MIKFKPKLFFITGISGSGKTTVGRKLCELGEVAFDSKIQKGLFHFSDSNGNQPNDYQPNNKNWMDTYKWVLNKPMFDNLIKQNDNAKRLFLCGGSDDLKQYWPLGEKVFLLKVNADIMIDRLNNKDRDNNFGKDKQTQEKLIERIERFQKKQIAAGAIPIDATKPISTVVTDILVRAV